MCIALGYTIAKIRIGGFSLGGTVGTLFAAIIVGQLGVEIDDSVKTLAFALFIYSLGFVSGPQFFNSLGRSTMTQVHLAVFTSVVVFATVWSLAQIFDLDKGTAAGLLAGATTESASVGTAGETLAHLDLDADTVATLQANVGVTYAVTYLFGFTLVVFFTSVIAPKMMGVNLREAAKAYEKELGEVGENLDQGQEEALRQVVGRVYEVTFKRAAGKTIAEVEKRYKGNIAIQQLSRRRRAVEIMPDVVLAMGDRVALFGNREGVIAAGDFLGEETGDLRGMVTVPIAGSPISLHTGGGCLISGLLFGWLRSKRPTFGSLPSATALHLKDFGLAMFVACVGLAVGPQAMTLLQEKGVLLPVLSVVVVLVPLVSSMYYARYVLKMNPVVICGALAGVLTSTPALNATVAEARSQSPVLGYTVPYAIANVFLTLLGPVIVLTT